MVLESHCIETEAYILPNLCVTWHLKTLCVTWFWRYIIACCFIVKPSFPKSNILLQQCWKNPTAALIYRFDLFRKLFKGSCIYTQIIQISKGQSQRRVWNPVNHLSLMSFLSIIVNKRGLKYISIYMSTVEHSLCTRIAEDCWNFNKTGLRNRHFLWALAKNSILSDFVLVLALLTLCKYT